jgi:hypothetical protein
MGDSLKVEHRACRRGRELRGAQFTRLLVQSSDELRFEG